MCVDMVLIGLATMAIVMSIDWVKVVEEAEVRNGI